MFEEYSFKSKLLYTWPSITANTTLEETQFIHRIIWDYAIEYGKKPITPYINNCPACEWAWIRKPKGRESICSACPIAWPDGKNCMETSSLYASWRVATGSADQDYARTIRNVEWKEPKND